MIYMAYYMIYMAYYMVSIWSIWYLYDLYGIYIRIHMEHIKMQLSCVIMGYVSSRLKTIDKFWSFQLKLLFPLSASCSLESIDPPSHMCFRQTAEASPTPGPQDPLAFGMPWWWCCDPSPARCPKPTGKFWPTADLTLMPPISES